MSPSPIPMPRLASSEPWPKPFGMRPNAPNVSSTACSCSHEATPEGSRPSRVISRPWCVPPPNEPRPRRTRANWASISNSNRPSSTGIERSSNEWWQTSSTTPFCTIWIADGSRSTRVLTGTAFGCASANSGGHVDSARADELFERFHRLDDARDRGVAGFGLGLSIVAAVAAAHEGRVWAEPLPEGGLAVNVDLPAATRPLTPVPVSPTPVPAISRRDARRAGGRAG